MVVNQAPWAMVSGAFSILLKTPVKRWICQAAIQPALFQRMLSRYQQYQRENGVLPLPAGYTQMKQLCLNTLQKSSRGANPIFLLTLLLLLPFYVAYRMKKDVLR